MIANAVATRPDRIGPDPAGGGGHPLSRHTYAGVGARPDGAPGRLRDGASGPSARHGGAAGVCFRGRGAAVAGAALRDAPAAHRVTVDDGSLVDGDDRGIGDASPRVAEDCGHTTDHPAARRPGAGDRLGFDRPVAWRRHAGPGPGAVPVCPDLDCRYRCIFCRARIRPQQAVAVCQPGQDLGGRRRGHKRRAAQWAAPVGQRPGG